MSKKLSLMDFLKSLRHCEDELCWSIDDDDRWIKELEQLQAENEIFYEQLESLSDIGNRVYRGNSVSYIYEKMKCYQRQIGIAGNIMRKHNLIDEFEQALKGGEE